MTVGALEGLEALSPRHLERFKAAVEEGKQVGWAYCFAYLLASERPGRRSFFLVEDDGSLCLFRWDAEKGDAPHLDLAFPPVPLSLGALARALERANDFNGDRSARVLRIDAQDVEAVESNRSLRVRQRRMQYMFVPARHEGLVGSEFRTVRRNVSFVERLPDVEVVPFHSPLAEGCRALLAEWRERHRSEHGTGGGVRFSRRLLEIAGTLPERDLSGEVVLIDGRVAGFAFGGMIRSGLACSLERKCDTSVRGLSYYQFNSFLRSLRGFDLVNDGSDAKRAGLRQFKDSFRPVAMEPEYRAKQVGGR